MSEEGKEILAKARKLPPSERASLVEKLLSSFEFPSRKKIDELWAKEAESRIEAYNHGAINSIPAKKVFGKIGKRNK